jgi:HK97 family phage major capsid protein
MLKIMVLRKRHKKMLEDAAALRAKQSGFAAREADLAAQVEAASSDEEIAAAAAAVAELEEAQKTTKERLETIIAEAEAIQEEIAAAEAAAAAAGSGDPAADGARSRRSNDATFQRRCQEFQRTGRIVYDNARSMVRAALLSSSNGVVGPTGVGGINDAAGNNVSDFLDLIKITDCTGMASYKVAYMVDDPTAAAGTEGVAPADSSPTFGFVELKPSMVDLLSYISREIRKQSPLQYEEKVNESIRRALRRVLSKQAIEAALASSLNSVMEISGANGAALFTPHLLSDIILAYGGDEGVDGAAVLVLNKADLRAFAAVRGKNEYLPVYSITPDAANPSMGVIKDNNGLSCRYCLNKNVAALSTATLSGTATKGMFYGDPQCLEMGMWGGVEVVVNEGYKFGEGLLTVRGEATADADVTVKNGFVIDSAKSA